jgi:peroxiredoxin (alkyl hydroperoxide reductase subunit C)
MSDDWNLHDVIEEGISDNAGHLAVAGALAAQAQRKEQAELLKGISQQMAAMARSSNRRDESFNSHAVSVGATVPDFTMETYEPAKGDFGSVSLADLKKAGKWTILVFYPADFTFVCPTELADLADQQDKLAALGAHVVAVSTDTKFAHMVWRNTEGLMKNVKYTLAADPTGTVSRLFGVYDGGSGLALRGTFIINPEGVIKTMEVHDNAIARDVKETLRKLKAAQFVANNPGQVCPAKWNEGAKTLTPSLDLVGKI